MLKSHLDQKVISIKPHFPCLMINNNLGFVILVTKEIGYGDSATYEGMVVHNFNVSNNNKIGHYSECWIKKQLIPYTGSVTLTEEN